VSLAGGASNKEVVVGLPDTDFRFSSVRPNRSSLPGAYGMFANRLRRRVWREDGAPLRRVVKNPDDRDSRGHAPQLPDRTTDRSAA